MAGSTQTQQTVTPLLRSCVLAETCDHRPVMPGSKIPCSGCGTGKKLKTMALEAKCKNSLSLECKGDVSIALGSPVQCQYRFVWRAVFSTIWEHECYSLMLPIPRTESTWLLNKELQLHRDLNNIFTTLCSCPFYPLLIFPWIRLIYKYMSPCNMLKAESC